MGPAPENLDGKDNPQGDKNVLNGESRKVKFKKPSQGLLENKREKGQLSSLNPPSSHYPSSNNWSQIKKTKMSPVRRPPSRLTHPKLTPTITQKTQLNNGMKMLPRAPLAPLWILLSLKPNLWKRDWTHPQLLNRSIYIWARMCIMKITCENQSPTIGLADPITFFDGDNLLLN